MSFFYKVRRKQVISIGIILCGLFTVPASANVLNSGGDEYYRKAAHFSHQAEYGQALSCYNRAAKSYKSNKQWNSYIQCLLNIGHYYIIKEKPAVTYEYLSDAEDLIKIQNLKNDHSLYSDVLLLKGRLLWANRQYKESVQTLQQFLNLKTREKQKGEDISAAYRYMGINHFDQHDYNKAMYYFSKAIEANNPNCQNTIETAICYTYLSSIHYTKNDFSKAIDYSKKNLTIISKISCLNKQEIVNSTFNIAFLYYMIGNYSLSEKYYRKAEKMVIKFLNKDAVLLGKIYKEIAHICYIKKDYEKSLNYYNKCLFLFTKNHSSDQRLLSEINWGIGNIYFFKKDYQKALTYYTKTDSNDAEIKPYFNIYLAKCYDELGEPIKSKVYFLKDLEEKRKRFGKDHVELIQSYINYGYFCLRQDDLQEAHRLFSTAYRLSVTYYGDKHPLVSECLADLGDYWEKCGRRDRACEFYQKSMMAAAENFTQTDIYSNPSVENPVSDMRLLYAMKSKARMLREMAMTNSGGLPDLKMLELSLKTYDLSCELIDNIRTRFSCEESLWPFAETEKETFAGAIETAACLYQHTKDSRYAATAFRFFEISKSASLLASVRNLNALSMGGISASLRKKEKNLKQEIAQCRKAIYEQKHNSDSTTHSTGQLEDKLFNLNRRMDDLISFYEKKYPDYYSLKYNTDVISLSSVQKKMNHDEALINYILYDNQLYIFAVTKKSCTIHTQTLDSSFYQHLVHYLGELKNTDVSHHQNSNFITFVQSSGYLYKRLVSPVESLVSSKKLIIIPDEELIYIPFETLLKPTTQDRNASYRTLPYLIVTNPVSYSYSATLRYMILQDKPVSSSGQFLAFAPDYSNQATIPQGQNVFRNIRQRLTPLPYIYKETSDIAKIMKGDMLTGNQATEKNFKNKARDYAILHLAMHAFIDEENPMYSKLVFNANPGASEDGFLNTYELYNLNIKPSMTVLSACNTGNGKLCKGEGVMSLARGFIYAGCPSIIMTLWSVDDEAGAGLMTLFYRHLSQGKTKDQALRDAKLDFIKTARPEKLHPMYWSSYVAIGDNKPLDKDNFRKNHWLSFFSLLGFFIGGFLLIKSL